MYNSSLKVFICVADYKSFSKAAEHLFISSPAVMKQINTLENHLGMKLMSRNNQGIRLTEAGKVIYTHAKKMIKYSERAIKEAKQIAEAESFTLNVGTSFLNPCKPFMDIWDRINDYFPECKFNLIPFDDNHMDILAAVDLLGEKFDFLVAACDSAECLNRCNFVKLGDYKVCCALPKKHLLANKKMLVVDDLYDKTLMMVKQGDSHNLDILRNELTENHPRIHIKDTSQFYDIEVFNQCIHNQCILLTLDYWTEIHPALTTIPVEWNYAVPYGLLYPLETSENIKKIIKEIHKALT